MKSMLVLLLFSTVVSANIGESKEELIKRYGDAKGSGDTLSFEKDGLRVVATLWKGKCSMIMFWLIGEGDAPPQRKFTSEETEAILSRNPAHSTYLPADPKFDKLRAKVRKSSDQKFIATTSPEMITIQSAEYNEARDDQPIK
ncbi:hypothetical protein OKA05_07580 [Luteolibacter arcticus]|uniref:Uncharacterized protein n=1 Tax=Luteolibacter arcticus TaxID=1581411 RepID=A0ABT3GFM8_9BACT|nr:hypothetical protein [Luteolibacter arcticus]MCW1922410.1 hypothetical protein [Luteolibacter arcticus]